MHLSAPIGSPPASGSAPIWLPMLVALGVTGCTEQDVVPTPGVQGPEPVVMADAVPAQAELVVPGAVDFAVALPDHAVVASREGTLLRREILESAAADLGVEAGNLLAAAVVDAETVIAGTEGLFVLQDGAPERSPLDALIGLGGAQRLLATGEDDDTTDLWIATPENLFAFRDGALQALSPESNAIEGAGLAWGAPVDGVPALWVVAGGVASAWVEAADGFSARPLDVDDVQSLAIDGTGTIWVVAGSLLHRRATDGGLRQIDFPVPLAAVFAGGSADLWLSDGSLLWHHAGGTFRPVEDVPEGDFLGVDSIGRLLVATPEGLVRIALGRPVVFLGLSEGDRVDLATTVTLAPSLAEEVVEVEASLDGDPLAVLADPWRLTIPAEDLADGDHRLDVVATYADDDVANASLFFHKGNLAPVTWEADILPLYGSRCDFCHGPSGGAHRLDTSQAWELDIDRILEAVEQGRMPRLPPQLDESEIGMIERWRSGGFQ